MSWRGFLVWLWLGWSAAGAGAAEPAVVLVSSETSAAYVELADTLAAELERSGTARDAVRRMTAAEFEDGERPTPRLFVALGVRAATALARTDERAPVLCTLLPRASFERILQQSGRKASSQFSAIYLDQPFSRRLDLVRLLLPQARRIGVLWSDETADQQAALEAAAASRGLRVVSAQVGATQTLFPALKKVLDDSDALLAVADPHIYNSGSIQNILLSSVRVKVPMVAFSPAYVKAGALAAVHVTQVQIGQQAALLARAVLQGRSLPGTPQYSREFEISVNLPVAHALALQVDAAALTARMRQLERAP